MNRRILRLKDVKAMTRLSRSTIYAEIARGHFPRQIKLTGARSFGWHESAVIHWIETREGVVAGLKNANRGDADI
ncbi:AlpA family transcriptional regulator [Kineobactrum sediminis]|uniref:AlpA family transcriptional regulator n=1 Tax=Kineobactrum sediminis TaxID=1905677 RepID=A0A2N5Y6A5_9GAMM|nr:AlpA family phage regulatory protein [Kineobactrum sediminis]PLW83917.1 AlpA family transcriptional regulator [Kineobactrum sediminis]